MSKYQPLGIVVWGNANIIKQSDYYTSTSLVAVCDLSPVRDWWICIWYVFIYTSFR